MQLLPPDGKVSSALCVFLVAAFGHFTQAQDIPMGMIGGTCQPEPGSGLVKVISVREGEPGEVAGLRAGDSIWGVDGKAFSVTNPSMNFGYLGAIQELGYAIDRAEGGTGILTLHVLRSGEAGLDLDVNVGENGEFGPAYPAGSAKADALYEWCVADLHSKVMASSSDNFGYNTGWIGMILLSHPSWNETTGEKPYRVSINQLRVRCEAFLAGEIYEPVEPVYHDGNSVIDNPDYVASGLNNWDVIVSAMFLALYKSITDDATIDDSLQRTAEMIGHRVQHWEQYDDTIAPDVFGGRVGRMGHGGVSGDYSRSGSIGALNIINAHALPALALLRNAGVDMSVNLGLSENAFTYNEGLAEPTIEEKFRICWDRVKSATRADDGDDDGNIGYVGVQSGWDSAGRTPGSFAGWHMYGMAPNADDTDKETRQGNYVVRRWYRQQHAHAHTTSGVVLSQFALPFLPEADARYFQENSRFYLALARQPDGSAAYIPGRGNNGGDSYTNFERNGVIHAAIPMAIRSGRLPGFPAPSADRILIHLRAPQSTWPTPDARVIELSSADNQALDILVTDTDGDPLAAADYTAAWTHLDGPGAVTFAPADEAATALTFPGEGTYRVSLQVTKDETVAEETFQFEVDTSPVPPGVPPYILEQPVDVTVTMGDPATLSVTAQGDLPMIFQWRLDGVNFGAASASPDLAISSTSAGYAGTYDCVISNPFGTITSEAVTLTVDGAGEFRPGGLWRDMFTGIDGGNVSDLTGAEPFPRFPDSSGVLPNGEPAQDADGDYGQRIGGWITPPESGDYRFYLAADDKAELWLSTTDKRADRVRVASKTSYNGYRSWSSAATSSLIPLVGGQRYYVEVLHKENGGGDHASFTWNWLSAGNFGTPTNGSEPLPGAILEYQVGGTFDDDIAPPSNYAPMVSDQSKLIYGGGSGEITIVASDFENDTLSYLVTANPGQGSVSGSGPTFTYTPNGGASGADSFNVRVSGGGSSTEITISLVIVPEGIDDIRIWTGATDDLWTASSNWEADTLPDANDAILFNSSSTANLGTSLGEDTSISRLVIADPDGTVAIWDNNLTIANGIEMRTATENVEINSGVTLGGSQIWAVGEGGTLLAKGSISGNDTLTKTGTGNLSLEAVSNRTGTTVVDEGTLTLNGGGWYQGTVGGSGSIIVNAGGTLVNQRSHAFGSSNNANRDLVLNGGRFQLVNGTYMDDLTMTAGTVENTVSSTSDLRSRSGSGSVLTVNAAASPSVIAAPYNLVGSAVFDIADGAADQDLIVSGPLMGTSTLTKQGGGRVLFSGTSTYSGNFIHTAGTVAVTGSFPAGSQFTAQAGTTLEGNGNIGGTVETAGELKPGLGGTAVFRIGNWTQTATGTTEVEIGGTAPGASHDQIAVAEAASLGGVLNVVLSDGFVPALDSRFQVVAAGSRIGEFSTVNLPALPTDRRWMSRYDMDGFVGLTLTVEGKYDFDTWTTDQLGSVPLALRSPGADADADGISNFLEFSLDLNPLDGAPDTSSDPYAGLPVIEVEGNTVSLIYRKFTRAEDLVYTVQETSDLEVSDSWADASVAESILSEEGWTQTVKASMPADLGFKFLRLRVTSP